MFLPEAAGECKQTGLRAGGVPSAGGGGEGGGDQSAAEYGRAEAPPSQCFSQVTNKWKGPHNQPFISS